MQSNNNGYSHSAQKAKETLESFKREMDELVREYFVKKIEEVKDLYTPVSLKSIEALRDITGRGGKRLRASLAYMVYQMYGGKDLKEAMNMGLVLELVHSYLMIEDDFMDKSDQRRGGPTAHVMLENHYKDRGFEQTDANHFGNSLAVTLGLTGFHIAMQKLNDLDFDNETKIRLSQNLNNKIEVTAHGQINDVFNAVSKNVTEDDVLNMLKWKTGVYTYENPIHTGAIMAGVKDSNEFGVLSGYAIPAGTAFQIQDDILGMFGDEEEIGKSTLDDLKEGKYTLLIHKVFEDGDEKQKNTIKELLGNREATKQQLGTVKDILVDTGSLDYSRNLAQELVLQAKKALSDGHNPSWNEVGVVYLNGIADYMIERKV